MDVPATMLLYTCLVSLNEDDCDDNNDDDDDDDDNNDDQDGVL